MRKLCLCLAAAFLLPLLFALAGCAEGDAARSRYEIDAVYDGGVLTAALDFTYYNDTESSEMTSLRFNLFGNAYREGAVYAPVSPAFRASAYYNGESWGEMNVLSVTPCAAWEVCGEDENVLRVDLAAGVFPGESAQLRIEYELRLAEVDHRTGITRGGTVNLGNFYPVLCVYDARDGFYECVYSSNGDFTPLASYIIKQVREVPGTKRYTHSRNIELPEATEPRLVTRYSASELSIPSGAQLLYRSPFTFGASQYVRYREPIRQSRGPTGPLHSSPGLCPYRPEAVPL